MLSFWFWANLRVAVVSLSELKPRGRITRAAGPDNAGTYYDLL